MLFRTLGWTLLAIVFLQSFPVSTSMGQGPFARGAGSGRFAPGPRAIPAFPPIPRSMAPQRALMPQPPIVGPFQPGIIGGRLVPVPAAPFSRLLGPAPAVALLVPVPNSVPPQVARRYGPGGRYEAGGSSYSTARPSVPATGSGSTTSSGVGTASLSAPLRPGMVLPDGSIVVSVDPVTRPAGGSGSPIQKGTSSDPTLAAIPESRVAPASGSVEGRFPSGSEAQPSNTESILEVETLPLPPPADESR